jgi:hypothetical protein
MDRRTHDVQADVEVHAYAAAILGGETVQKKKKRGWGGGQRAGKVVTNLYGS